MPAPYSLIKGVVNLEPGSYLKICDGKILSSANNQYSFNITLLLLLVIFCLDFFTHSTVLIQEASMTYTFYLLIYFGFSQRRSFDISNVNRNTKS